MKFKKNEEVTLKSVLSAFNRHPWAVIYTIVLLLGAWLASGIQITLQSLGVGILLICFIWGLIAVVEYMEENK